MNKISILVVVYNKEIKESSTICNIFKFIDGDYFSLEEVKLVIWNNGPERIKINISDSLHCEYRETLYNESLSTIYNRFISEYPSDKYVILDHDSSITQGYVDAIMNSSYDIALPIIKNNQVTQYPKINGSFCHECINFSSTGNKIVSVSSGLSISNDVVNALRSVHKNVFDERFRFYGVDTTFFYRVFDLKRSFKVSVIPGFEHSLSKNETESYYVNKFRIHERSIDLSLTMKYYKDHVSIVKLILRTIYYSNINFFKKKKLYSVLKVIKFYFSGKHDKNAE